MGSCFLHSDSFGCSKFGKAVEGVDTDVEFGDLSVEFAGHEALAEELRVLGDQVESGDSFRCDSVIHHSCREEVDMDG